MNMIEKVAKSLNLDPGNAEHRNMARAAIEAMREPTESMRAATYMRDWEAEGIWEAMIDAALKEE